MALSGGFSLAYAHGGTVDVLLATVSIITGTVLLGSAIYEKHIQRTVFDAGKAWLSQNTLDIKGKSVAGRDIEIIKFNEEHLAFQCKAGDTSFSLDWHGETNGFKANFGPQPGGVK